MRALSELFLRLKRQFNEGETAEQRSTQRYLRVALTILSSLGGRGLNVLVSLISISLTSHYLDSTRLGILMTISGIGVLLTFADFGIGNGLLNAISQANGRNDPLKAAKAISCSALMLAIIGFSLYIVFFFIDYFSPWKKFFNISNDAVVEEVGKSILTYIFCFTCIMQGSVVERVRTGYQQGYINHIFYAAGCLFGLVFVLLATSVQAGLPWLVLATEGGTIIGRLLNGVLLFGWQKPELRPKLSLVGKEEAHQLFRIGILFFLLQMSVPAIMSFDKFLVSNLMGAERIVQYSVPLRLFEIAAGFIGVAIMPFWPAYTEAIVRKDILWIRRTVWRVLMATSLVMGVTIISLSVFGNWIITHWVGPAYHTDTMMFIGIGLTTYLVSIYSIFAVFLNAMNKLKGQVLLVWGGIAATMTLKIYLGNHYGLQAFVWASAIGLGVFMLAPYLVYAIRVLRNLEHHCDQSGSL